MNQQILRADAWRGTPAHQGLQRLARDPSGSQPEDFLVLVGLLWRILPPSSGEARVKRLHALALRG
jgi:hypothetical protein